MRSLGLRSIFREQVLEIVLRQALREPLLPEHVGDGLRLALLEFPNLFFNRSGRDEPVGIDGARLADAVRAVDGLGLDGGIPPRIVEDDVARVCEVQPPPTA